MIKVMIVDDDKLVRKGLMSAMPWRDFDMEVVGEASNGEKALEFIAANAVDLLLTDLAMPVMSGIELLKIVRKQYPSMYTVVLTFHQDFEYIQEALRLGAIDYIAKVQLEKERFEEVLGRIHKRILEEQKHAPQSDLFYEGSFTQDEDIQGNVQTERAGNEIDRVKEQWSGHEWISQDHLFRAQVLQLKQMRLPQTKLIGLLYALTDKWNLLFNPVHMAKIGLPDTFESWQGVEEWLTATRDMIRKAKDKPAFSQEVVESIMKAVHIVNGEIQEQITAAMIAKRVNMSRSYFSQCFKEIIGINFSEYLRNHRIDKAKEYLLYTNKTILWIAEHVGYMDEKYFSRTFREQTGVLPSEYRLKGAVGRKMSEN
ncbi:response regulator transcription factor [Paenibacillus aceris]|uniref:Two-component system response regulator YesN n=1 Tax=Paenibacillus aceris TaxID=869555 RepID=A0ABS4I3E0_9BACL|nr:response regulator [Paenibacillus aceris]MBP1965446.1 two-component system response regulator YesN [Paenibacillus aceris]NHW33503.1 response regulator [Paenibacillus aceris]